MILQIPLPRFMQYALSIFGIHFSVFSPIRALFSA